MLRIFWMHSVDIVNRFGKGKDLIHPIASQINGASQPALLRDDRNGDAATRLRRPISVILSSFSVDQSIIDAYGL